MAFTSYPWSNIHELNLDWIIKTIKLLNDKVDEYLEYATITYADPLLWNITSQYKENTVVVDDSGNAYLSVQAVPANISITDTAYWTPIGNFSELYRSIKTAICTIDFGTGSATTSISKDTVFWQNDILRRALTDITSGQTINNDNSEPVNIVEMINATTAQEENNRRYIFIGDSFGQGYNPDGDTTSYVEQIKNRLNLSDNDIYISNVGGSGFLNGTTFLNQLANLYPSINDKLSITDIFVLGGRNDYNYGISELKSAISAFMTYCNAYFPNATVHIGFIGRAYEHSDNTQSEFQFRTLSAYTQCQTYGARYIQNIEYVLADSSLFASDGRHPTQDGQNALTEALLTYIKGGNITVSWEGYIPMNPSGINTRETTYNIRAEVHNDITTYTIGSRNVTANENRLWNGTPFELYTLPRTFAEGSKYSGIKTSVPAIARFVGSPRYRAVTLGVTLIENKIYGTLNLINDEGNNFLTATIDELQFPIFTLSYTTIGGE